MARMTRSPWTRFALALLTAALLSACAMRPRTVTLGEERLNSQLATRFPVERRWLEVFDLQVAAPRVSMRPAQDRVRADVGLRLGDRLFNRSFSARVGLLAGVRYEPADHSLRLRDVSVAEFAVDGADGALLARAGHLPASIVSTLLEDATVYRLPQEQVARLQRAGWTVRDLRVTDSGLQFTLGPLR